MGKIIYKRILIAVLAVFISTLDMMAVSLWVGQSYSWDFSGSILGSVYNMSVSTSGGYLSVTGSGFYRTITPTQYFSGTATVTAEWDYTLYSGDTKRHQKVTLSVSCYENPVSISPTSVTLSPGETYQLGYSHQYQNSYVGAANAYFSGGNSSFSVSSSGLITAKAPGSGYVNVYSKISSAANAPACYVTVKEVDVTGASVGNINLLAEQNKALTVNVSPSNATVKSKQWYIKSGSDIVSISGQTLYALAPGTATIYCMVNGSVRSNDATVTVSEPKLTLASSSPAEGATDISVFNSPTVTYSHTLYKGDAFNSIAMTANGEKIAGEVELTDKTIRFMPSKPLAAKTVYKLSVPRNAVKNKWGSYAQSDVTLSFTTGEKEKATVKMTPVSGSYLTVNEGVTITSTPSDATIYYTTDGSKPTTSSNVYTAPVNENKDFKIKAIAIREGYDNSDVAEGEYFKSLNEITDYFPQDAKPLFKYSLVTPWLKLSGAVEKSNNFRKISLKDANGTAIEGEAFITNHIIVFVPANPLENCSQYTMDIPRDAVKSVNGETFIGFSWTFTTSVMPKSIATMGDESVFVLSENGQLDIAGMDYVTTSTSNGSFTFKDYEKLTQLATNVDTLAAGYTHRLIQKGGTISGQGLAMCGETGTAASIAKTATAITIKAGFQTSAIIDENNSLWMSGRNDFYQLGNETGTTAKEFIQVADNVIDVALGNGYTLYVDEDNVMWGVGRNHKGQLGDGTLTNRRQAVKIKEGVAKVFASTSGYFSACITTDGRLMTWGDNSQSQLGRENGQNSKTPQPVLDNVVSASLGDSHVLALCDDYKVYAWGDNKYRQIATSGNKVERPTIMAQDIISVCAGPNTSLLMAASGKITGWGRKTHSNFGSGGGNATDYTLAQGRSYSILTGAAIEPYYYEQVPGSRFAFVMTPQPINADYDTVEWSSDNPNVAEVDERGIITTNTIGKAVITVTVTNKFGVSKKSKATVVCTYDPDNSGVSNVSDNSDNWRAYSVGLSIVIEDAAINQSYEIYNLQGVRLDSQIANDSTIRFGVNQTGVYLIKSGTTVVKVICR